jgi:hypothetical protein
MDYMILCTKPGYKLKYGITWNRENDIYLAASEKPKIRGIIFGGFLLPVKNKKSLICSGQNEKPPKIIFLIIIIFSLTAKNTLFSYFLAENKLYF